MMKGKPVPSLQDMCLDVGARMTHDACENIEINYGDYSKNNTFKKVEMLQKYLLDKLGPAVNSLYERVIKLPILFTDKRILYSLAMHKYVRYFIHRMEIIYANIEFDHKFWEFQVGKLVGIHVLDIREIHCSDQMMATICSTCTQLEVLRIDSKPSAECLDLGPVPSIPSITSTTLEKLTLLKNLRVIEDVSNFVSFPIDFVKSFFHQLLPKLENFHHSNLEDFILKNLGQLKSLPLKSLKMFDVRSHNLLAMLRLCPDLNQLELCESLYGGIFDDLTNCPTKITNFSVYEFQADFIPGLFHYLLNKGEFLISFTLDTDAVININDVQTIGECCPNLQVFDLSLRITRPVNYNKFKAFNTERPLFSNLNSLSLKGCGPNWNSKYDDRIVELFVNLGQNITALCLEGNWIISLQKAMKIKKAREPTVEILPNLMELKIFSFFMHNVPELLLWPLLHSFKKLAVLCIRKELYCFTFCDDGIPVYPEIKIILISTKNGSEYQ